MHAHRHTVVLHPQAALLCPPTYSSWRCSITASSLPQSSTLDLHRPEPLLHVISGSFSTFPQALLCLFLWSTTVHQFRTHTAPGVTRTISAPDQRLTSRSRSPYHIVPTLCAFLHLSNMMVGFHSHPAWALTLLWHLHPLGASAASHATASACGRAPPRTVFLRFHVLSTNANFFGFSFSSSQSCQSSTKQ